MKKTIALSHMAKTTVIAIALCLVLIAGLALPDAMANASDDIYIFIGPSGTQTEKWIDNVSIGGLVDILPNPTASDFSTLRIFKDGVEMPYEVREITISGYYHYLYFVTPFTEPGVYAAEFTYKGIAYTSSDAAMLRPEDYITEPLPPPTEDTLSLIVEVRSATQAIITLTDTRLPAIIDRTISSQSGPQPYSGWWEINFGDDGKYLLKMHTNGNNPSRIEPTIDSPLIDITDYIPLHAARRPHRPHDLRPPIDERSTRGFSFTQIENGFIWEISALQDKDIDFTDGLPFVVRYTGIEGGHGNNQDMITITYDAADVVEMRNYGQEYDIGVDTESFAVIDLPQWVYGMTHEQSERLYFTPPERRYAIAHAAIENVHHSASGEEKPFRIEFDELIEFDETGMVTNVVGRLMGEGSENWMNGVNYVLNGPIDITKVKLVTDMDNSEGTYIGYVTFRDYYLNGGSYTVDEYLEMLESGNSAWNVAYTIVRRVD